MKLKNNFTENVSSIINEIQPCCQICGSNEMCSIHHIFSRQSNAISNAIKLCCKHHKTADNYNKGEGKSKQVRNYLVHLTLKSLYKNTWWEHSLTKQEKSQNEAFLSQLELDKVLSVEKPVGIFD